MLLLFFCPSIPEMCVKPKIIKMYAFTHVSLHLLNCYRMLWWVKTHYDCMLNCACLFCSCLNEARMIDTENKERFIPQNLSVLWILLISRICTFLETVLDVYRLYYMSSFRLKDNWTVFYPYCLTRFDSRYTFFLKYCIL